MSGGNEMQQAISARRVFDMSTNQIKLVFNVVQQKQLSFLI
jgi:hypothetical protein